MGFGRVFDAYVVKVEMKGRTKAELMKVLTWLTGYSGPEITKLRKPDVTLEAFFKKAKLNWNAKRITGVVCGVRVEDIENKLTQKVRYMDKLVDELAKGWPLEKILRA